ncbi:MAG TPA: diguanylate cyclase [Oscillospiraceae bacterium]|nr:diguanylate cyclase [Oscillospiraceae bacterium]
MHCTGKKRNGFTLLEMLVIVAVVALLAAMVIPVYNDALEKTRESVCTANRRSLYAVLSMRKLTDKLDTLEDALDAYEAEGRDLLAEYPCIAGGVISVEGDAVICSIHGHEGSKTYFSGISGGTIQDYRSVLIDFSETVPAYLGEMYKLEVLSSGKLNGFWETEGAVFHDSLTGLYDRRFAMETLNMYIAQKATPLSVVLGDINGLKKINDIKGYNAGDEVLMQIAWILQEHCRGKDIAARWSDDEYLLVFPYTSAEETRLLLNQLQEALKELSGDMEDDGIMTFGYATSDADTRGAEELIREAEKWMYRKKMLVSHSYRGSIMKLLLSTLHEKSPETQEHSNRMADYCRWVAEKLGLSDEAINDLVILAMLHDIGKMGINRKILNKPGPLSVEERREIEQHPEIGYRITRNIPELSQVSQYILAHHERWDGDGYPNKLRGEEIPLASRIISVVDAYDVMTSGRVYRPARSAEEALAELSRCAGTQFDPTIVDIFTELITSKVLHITSSQTKEEVSERQTGGQSPEENDRPSPEEE